MSIGNHVPIEGIPTDRQINAFHAKVGRDPSTGCHPWTAARQFHPFYPDDLTQAQGRFGFNGRTVTAYRFAMFLELGFQDPGPTVDHLCHNRICVNPQHLRCVPQVENNRTRRPTLSDYCKNGHIRTLDNTRITPNGRRSCRDCERIQDRKRYKAKYAKEKSSYTHSSESKDYASNPKLNEEKVKEILNKYHYENLSSRILAREYTVSPNMILLIVRGESWKHIYNNWKRSGEKGV